MFKQVLLTALKVIVLTIIMVILFMFGSATFGPTLSADQTMSADEASFAGIAVIIVSLVDTLILMALIARSRLWSWRLMLVTGIVFFGVKSFMSQIESWYFLRNVTNEMLIGIALMYLPATVLFPPITVWVLGKVKRPADADAPNPRLIMPGGQFALKLAALGLIVYPLLYLTFGYFIALKNPAIQAFYGISDPGSFFAQLQVIAQTDPLLLPFQFMRAFIWIALAAPIIRWTKGGAWQAGLITALAFALIMNDVHLYPNPLMPREVSTTHFIETASSNIIWGLAIVWLLHRAHRSLADVFGLAKPSDQEAKRVAHA